MKKIAYLITKSNWGGAQKAVYDLATHPKTFYNFEVIVASGNEGELLEKLKDKSVKTENLKIENNINPFQAIKNLWSVYKFLKRERPDVVHLHSSKMSLLGSVAARLTRTPMIIFTAHGWPHNEDRNFLTRTVFYITSTLTVLLSHRTIAVSENIANSIKLPKFIKKKILVIYNGIQKVNYNQLPKLSSGSGSKIKHIVSVGELNDNKNHMSVINVLPQIKNIHYHIIGEGKLRPQIEKNIKNKNLEKRVTLYGHINNAKELLSQYDAFILPSKTEALGYVVLEALQAGIPVIARNVGGVPEILRDLPHSYLYKYDTDLIDILDKDLTQYFTWYDPRFDFEKMIDKTIYLYK